MDFDIFGRNVTDKVGNQKMLYYATLRQITCASALPGKTGKHENHIFAQSDCVTRTVHLCASSWKKKLSSVMCLIASNICWDSKISH